MNIWEVMLVANIVLIIAAIVLLVIDIASYRRVLKQNEHIVQLIGGTEEEPDD